MGKFSAGASPTKPGRFAAVGGQKNMMGKSLTAAPYNSEVARQPHSKDGNLQNQLMIHSPSGINFSPGQHVFPLQRPQHFKHHANTSNSSNNTSANPSQQSKLLSSD